MYTYHDEYSHLHQFMVNQWGMYVVMNLKFKRLLFTQFDLFFQKWPLPEMVSNTERETFVF